MEPNNFELSGPGTEVAYTTSGFPTGPVFAYDGPHGSGSFRADDITIAGPTALGTEVTVTLREEVDRDRVTATLLVPSVRLTDGQDRAISTLLIVTTNRSTIAGPPPGAAQLYDVVELKGKARMVRGSPVPTR